MTIRTPSWLQAGSYPAENDRLLLQSLLSGSPNQTPKTGIIGATDLAVTASATPDMNVHVAAGAAFIAGSETLTQGVYGFYSDASVTVPIAASTSQPRISLIVAEVLDAGYSGSSNIGQIIEVAGVPASSPVAPATPKNAIVLAQVSVAASVASITGAAITDKRTAYDRIQHASMRLAAAQSFANTTTTVVAYDTVLSDPFNLCTTGANAKITLQKSGIYLVTASIELTGGTSGEYIASIGGSQAWSDVVRLSANTAFVNVAVSVPFIYNAGDTVQFSIYQSTGAAKAAAGAGSSFMVVRLGSA